jgi:hypothetical protein
MNSSSRNSLIDYGVNSKIDPSHHARSSKIYKKKKTSFTSKDEFDSKNVSKIRPKDKQKTLGGENMKSSLVEDLSESNFDEIQTAKD